MNWYKLLKIARLRPNWESVEKDLVGIKEMIQSWGNRKGIDSSRLDQMVKDARYFLSAGHDVQTVRSLMRDKLQSA